MADLQNNNSQLFFCPRTASWTHHPTPLNFGRFGTCRISLCSANKLLNWSWYKMNVILLETLYLSLTSSDEILPLPGCWYRGRSSSEYRSSCHEGLQPWTSGWQSHWQSNMQRCQSKESLLIFVDYEMHRTFCACSQANRQHHFGYVFFHILWIVLIQTPRTVLFQKVVNSICLWSISTTPVRVSISTSFSLVNKCLVGDALTMLGNILSVGKPIVEPLYKNVGSFHLKTVLLVNDENRRLDSKETANWHHCEQHLGMD